MSAVRMNITLPEDVVKILKKKTKSGEKSAFIAEAIRSFALKETQADLIKRMIEGYESSNALTDEDQEWMNADLGESDNEY